VNTKGYVKKFVGIFSIAHTSGQVRKRAGGVSPPMENQHTSQPNGGLTPPARCAAPTVFLHTQALGFPIAVSLPICYNRTPWAILPRLTQRGIPL